MKPLLAAGIMLVLAATNTRPLARAQDEPQTLRTALAQAGFGIPAGLQPDDLDRQWDSSESTHDDKQLVAAIYFRDEMEAQHGLGPLHLVRITKSGAVNRLRLPGDDPVERGGSIIGISFEPGYTFVHTHVNPSAGYTLVLNDKFALVASLYGFPIAVLRDGTILFEASMVHFAPMHQQTLRMFSPATNQTTEIFPGTLPSKYGPLVMQRVQQTLDRIAAERGVEVTPNEFDIVDFDRSIGHVRVSGSGRDIAFTVSYGSDRMDYQDPDNQRVNDRVRRKDPSWPEYSFTAIARCRRGGSSWTCREDDLATVAKQHNLALPVTPESIERLIERLLVK